MDSNIDFDAVFDEALATPVNSTDSPATDSNEPKTEAEQTTPAQTTQTTQTPTNSDSNDSPPDEIAEGYSLIAKQLLSTKFGIPEKDLEGLQLSKPEEFGDLMKDFVDSSIQHKVDQILSDPMVKELYEFTQAGGNFKDWLNYHTNPFDPAKATIATRDEQREVTKIFLENSTDLDDNTIGIMLNTFEEKGLLEAKATDALRKLQQMQIDHTKQTQAQQQAQIEAQRKEEAEYQAKVKQVIFNGGPNELGAEMPAELREKFWNYLTVPKPELGGKTQNQHDIERDPYVDIKEAANRFLGFTNFESKKAASLKLAEKQVIGSLKNQTTPSSGNRGLGDTTKGDANEFAEALRKLESAA